MPAGELLIEAIAEHLSVQTGKTAEDIHAELPGHVSKRAVRYALERLMDQGLAKRGQRSRRGHYWTAVVRPL